MAPAIIALASAVPGAGKTTAERHLARKGYAPMRIGDAVKAEVSAMTIVHGVVYDETQKETFRGLLSAWSEFRIRSCGENYWMDLAIGNGRLGNIVIPDVRYPAEFRWCKRNSAVTIFITRAGATRSDHPSEGRLNPEDFDHVICNDADDGGAAMFAAIDALLADYHRP